jgi:hypothetical protein
MDGAQVPAPDVDSYQWLEKRSHRPIERGFGGPRQVFDGFDEVLTTCAAVNRLLVVEGMELPQERNSRNVFTGRSMRTGSVQVGGEGEPMEIYMHITKVGAWRKVCFLPLRESTPKSERLDS